MPMVGKRIMKKEPLLTQELFFHGDPYGPGCVFGSVGPKPATVHQTGRRFVKDHFSLENVGAD